MTKPVTPETLTDEMIEAYQRSIVRSLTTSSRGADEACRDAEWATGFRGAIRRDSSAAHEARQRICDAINARASKDGSSDA